MNAISAPSAAPIINLLIAVWNLDVFTLLA
jgi:hypothetical protein